MEELIGLLSMMEARKERLCNTIARYHAELEELENLIAEIEKMLEHNGCKKIPAHWVGGNEE